MNFTNYLKAVSVITVISLCLFALPLTLLDGKVGLGYIAGIPPQLFVTLSWICGWEYAQKHFPDKAFGFTLAATPIRFLVEIAWVLLLMQIDTINIGVAVGSAMMHFALYTIPQVMCIRRAMDYNTT